MKRQLNYSLCIVVVHHDGRVPKALGSQCSDCYYYSSINAYFMVHKIYAALSHSGTSFLFILPKQMISSSLLLTIVYRVTAAGLFSTPKSR